MDESWNKSFNNEYYIPCIIIYIISQVLFYMWQPYLTNKPYVYSWFYTNKFSQIN